MSLDNGDLFDLGNIIDERLDEHQKKLDEINNSVEEQTKAENMATIQQRQDARKNTFLMIEGISNAVQRLGSSFTRITTLQDAAYSRGLTLAELSAKAQTTFFPQIAQGIANITAKELQTDRLSVGYLRQSLTLNDLLIESKNTGQDSRKILKTLVSTLAGSRVSTARQEEFFGNLLSITQSGNVRLDEITQAIGNLSEDDAMIFDLLGISDSISTGIATLTDEFRFAPDKATKAVSLLFGTEGLAAASLIGMQREVSRVRSGEVRGPEVARITLLAMDRMRNFVDRLIDGAPGLQAGELVKSLAKNNKVLLQLAHLDRVLEDSLVMSDRSSANIINKLGEYEREADASRRAITDNFADFGTQAQTSILDLIKSNEGLAIEISKFSGMLGSFGTTGGQMAQMAAAFSIPTLLGQGGKQAIKGIGKALLLGGGGGLLISGLATLAAPLISSAIEGVGNLFSDDTPERASSAQRAQANIHNTYRESTSMVDELRQMRRSLERIDESSRYISGSTRDTAASNELIMRFEKAPRFRDGMNPRQGAGGK